MKGDGLLGGLVADLVVWLVIIFCIIGVFASIAFIYFGLTKASAVSDSVNNAISPMVDSITDMKSGIISLKGSLTGMKTGINDIANSLEGFSKASESLSTSLTTLSEFPGLPASTKQDLLDSSNHLGNSSAKIDSAIDNLQSVSGQLNETISSFDSLAAGIDSISVSANSIKSKADTISQSIRLLVLMIGGLFLLLFVVLSIYGYLILKRM